MNNQSKNTSKSKTPRLGAKALIMAASVMTTVSGWAVISHIDPYAATTVADAQQPTVTMQEVVPTVQPRQQRQSEQRVTPQQPTAQATQVAPRATAVPQQQTAPQQQQVAPRATQAPQANSQQQQVSPQTRPQVQQVQPRARTRSSK